MYSLYASRKEITCMEIWWKLSSKKINLSREEKIFIRWKKLEKWYIMKFIRSEEFSQKREQIIRRYDINYKFKIYKSNSF